VASRLADRLVGSAVWLDDRCNWVGADPVDLRNSTSAGVSVSYRALGPTLYGGSSGVALFLAELAAATGRDDLRPTALAALRHAISRQDDVPAAGRLGYYTGWSGLAAAALRAGRLLESTEFVDAGTNLLHELARLAANPPADQEFDLISGVAGAVLALGYGVQATGEPAVLDGLVAAADWLVRMAERTATGWSWRSPGLRNQHNLTGLSHGTAGVAVALLEAYRYIGDERYATGARLAMRYENRWFDRVEGNWPDFRENRADRRSRTFVALWCHGAPGIALSRLYAYRVLGEERWRHDALTAIATTQRVTGRLVETGNADFSLCHGLAGNAEAFLIGSRVLGPELVDLAVPALVAAHGAERYAHTGAAWPCGTQTDETPSLLLGLAGIAHFYLRQAVPTVPSVLLPVRWPV
jgi:lantibiotic modifying enzyme